MDRYVRCADCVYVSPESRCRRYPPVIVPEYLVVEHGKGSMYPVVEPEGWCGEWRLRLDNTP